VTPRKTLQQTVAKSVFVALLLAMVLLGAGCGGDDNGESDTMGCDVTTEGSTGPPDIEPLDEGKTHSLVFKTNQGSFTVELDTETAPCTTASLVDLAGKGFFNGTIFHRIVPGFVIQGGDPTGTGTGGPGYKTVDTPPSDARYTKGVVAMAKTQDEPPGTSGSQFFVVTGADVGLPADYAIVGKVVEGLDVVEKIGNLGGPDEQPKERVEIETAEAKTS
jgi:peptidyl-prolyl cis-trans isomerase B (cyclophilin B)